MQVPVAEFLQQLHDRVLLDVRSPGEYTQAHIPGAISFPLFTDEERAKVGTLYKQTGKDAAFEQGLRFVGPKMADFVRQARKLSPERRLAVHCWRGGQRSGSMAWLLRSAGFDVVTLEGGYKQYRQHVLDFFSNLPELDLRVVGGGTGTGKTKMLHYIGQSGQQIIDLEGLAHHKGSAFGFIGEAPQPTVEQFENDLFQAMQQLDFSLPIWIENESRSIGRVYQPAGFWARKSRAPLYNIQIPKAARIQNLLADYVLEHREALYVAFQKIEQKLGGQHFKAAIDALEQGDFATAADIALVYYDKTYQHCLDTSESTQVYHFEFDHGDPQRIAADILAVAPSIAQE